MNDDHQIKRGKSALGRVKISTRSRKEPKSEDLSAELHLDEFLERFQQLSWDLSCSHRESTATPEQAENATAMTKFFTFWINSENVKTVQDASIKGHVVGELLYEMALEKDHKPRHIAEWFELIEDGVDSAAGREWKQLLRPEDSEQNKQFNGLLVDELEYLKEKQRNFLSCALKALDGYDRSDTATEGSDETVMELGHMSKQRGKNIERDDQSRVRGRRGD